MNHPLQALPPDYADWLSSLKQRIRGARQHALLAVNDGQIRLYHDIGRDILNRQSEQGWGAKVIDHLAADLQAAFPGMKGFSARNLKYIIGQQAAAQLPWFHIVTIITKVADPALPEPLDISLPSIEDIEAELSRDLGVDDDAEHGASGGEA